MTPFRVLLAPAAGPPAADLAAALEAAGAAVTIAASTPTTAALAAVDALVVEVGGKPSAAVSLTRLCRAETGDRPTPILWVLPEPSAALTVAGLDAGADVCLPRPLDPAVLAAHLRTSRRWRTTTTELADRAADTGAVNDRLHAAYTEAADAVRLAAAVRSLALPARLPAVGSVRLGVSHRSADPDAVGLYDVARLDDHHVGFWVADAGGRRSIAGELVRLAVRLTVPTHEATDDGRRLVPPAEILDRVNRSLIRLALDPAPFVGLAYGLIDTRTGAVSVARAGLPPAVHVPADGRPEPWVGPGPFLGAFDAEFPPRTGTLHPGDRLVLTTAGDPEQVVAMTEKHRKPSAPEAATAIADEVVSEGGGRTVLVIDRANV